jgi:radical SAM protein with 4Fe4S-binding SPASM domain
LKWGMQCMRVPKLKEINVEITQKCLQNCIHCSSMAHKDASEKLLLSEFEGLVSDLQQLGTKTMQISGGEPLLHDDVFSMIDLSKDAGMSVELFTCGMIANPYDESIADSVVEQLSIHRPDKIIVSLQGSWMKTHDAIARTPGSFVSAKTLISKLVDQNHYVGVHFVPMVSNLEEIEGVVKLAISIGVQEIGVLRFVPQGRGRYSKDSQMLSPEEIARLVEELVRIKNKYSIDIRVGSHLDFLFLIDGKRAKECKAGKEKCLVGPNGDVIPCAVFKDLDGYVAENIRKKTIQEIWKTSSVFAQFREFVPKQLSGSCSVCKHLSKCKGRCPGQRVYDYNNFYRGPDRCCPLDYYNRKREQGEI